MDTHKGFDVAREVASIVSDIPDEIDWAGRYYSRNPAKNLSAEEAKILCAADLKLVTVWEGQADAPKMGSHQGTLDGAAALLLASKVGQPEGTCVYFAVDFDATPSELRARVLPYFAGINAALKGRYRIGAYGSGLTLSTLKRSGLIDYAWLGGARGWSGSKLFLGWHIKQGLPGDPYDFGFEIDPNEAQGEDYGAWSLGNQSND